MAGEGLQRRPARVALTNVETGEAVSAQFNPDEVREKLGVNFNNLDVLGASHQPKQYQNTGNLAVSFALGFDALSVDGGNVEQARFFLLSLCFPSREAQGVADGGTPRVLLSWPNLYAITGKIVGLDFTHKRFNLSMKSVLFVCEVSFEWTPKDRVYSEDVRAFGTIVS